MSDWGKSIYGDPCKGCGFGWPSAFASNIAVVRDVPGQLQLLVEERDASLRHPDLRWSIGQYICHVGDNLRIYAERLAGIAEGVRGTIAPYDQDSLAAARRYELIPLESSLWALERAVRDWYEAAGEVELTATVTHPERGQQTAMDLIATSAHDAYHHVWDVRRSIEANDR